MAATHNVEIESTTMNEVLPRKYLTEMQEKKELLEKYLQKIEVIPGMHFEYNGLLGPLHTPPKPKDAQSDATSQETSHRIGEPVRVAAADADVAKEEFHQEEETENESVYWDSESKDELGPEASDTDSDVEDYFSCVSSDSEPDELV